MDTLLFALVHEILAVSQRYRGELHPNWLHG